MPSSPPWRDPTVGTGKDLIVQPGSLRAAGKTLNGLASELQTAWSRWQMAVLPASQPATLGTWPEGTQLAAAVSKTHSHVFEFMTDLIVQHELVGDGLAKSAQTYADSDATAAQLSKDAHRGSARRIQYGGVDTRRDRRETTHEKWSQTRDVTAGARFRRHSVTGYSGQQVKDMVAATDPDAITAAGDGYRRLHGVLADIADVLARKARTLADTWAGQSAVKAMNHVEMLYQTAHALSGNAHQTAQALTEYGPQLKRIKARVARMPAGPGPYRPAATAPAAVGLAGVAHPAGVAAGQRLQAELGQLNDHIETAYHQMPSAIRVNLPPAPKGPPLIGDPPRQPIRWPVLIGDPPRYRPVTTTTTSTRGGTTTGGGNGPQGTGRWQPEGPALAGGTIGGAAGGVIGGTAFRGRAGAPGTDATVGSDGVITSGTTAETAAASTTTGWPAEMAGGNAPGQDDKPRTRDTFGETEDEQTWRPDAEAGPAIDASAADPGGVLGGAAAPEIDDYTYDYAFGDDDQLPAAVRPAEPGTGWAVDDRSEAFLVTGAADTSWPDDITVWPGQAGQDPNAEER